MAASPAIISSGYGEPRVVAPGEAIPLFVSGRTVERWEVSDPDVARIEPEGYHHCFVGKRAGTVTVAAIGADFETRETFHVADLSQVKSVDLVLREKGHEPNVFRLQAFAVHDHLYRREVTEEPGVEWSSSDDLVARFDAASPGTLRGVGDGGVRVSIAFGGCTHSRDFHVQGGVLSAIDAPMSGEGIIVGVSSWLSVSRRSTDGGWSATGEGAVFTASPAGMVAITKRDGRSIVKGLRAGRVTIGARWGSLYREREVEVRSLELRMRRLRHGGSGPEPVLVFLGDELEVSTHLGDWIVEGELNFTWSSSPEGVLELDARGSYAMAKGIGVGKAKVAVHFTPTGETRELTLNVQEAPEINWF